MNTPTKTPRPSYFTVVFVAWLMPMLGLFVVDGLVAAAGPIGRVPRHVDADAVVLIGVLNAMFCVPVTLGLMLIVRGLLAVLEPPLSRLWLRVRRRLRRTGTGRVYTPVADGRRAEERPRTVAVGLGTLLGSGWGLAHVTGYMAMTLHTSEAVFFGTLVVTGGVCGLLIGLRRAADLAAGPRSTPFAPSPPLAADLRPAPGSFA